MFQGEVPLRFWPFSILTATSKVLNWDTPYKLIFKDEPDYSKLKPFGCLAYAMNLTPHRNKFTFKNHKCIFLRYSSSHKGYLLFYLENNKLLTSRDVHFVTDLFPFQSSHPEHTLVPPLPLVNPNVFLPSAPILDMSVHGDHNDAIATDSVPLPTTIDTVVPVTSLPNPLVLRRSTRVAQPPV